MKLQMSFFAKAVALRHVLNVLLFGCVGWLLVPIVASAQTPSVLEAPTTQVTAGGYHTCALTTAGGVQCWGYNDHGQLGNGTTTDSHTPMAVTGLSTGVAAIAAGFFHTCALTTAGGVQCWGYNANGELGNGTTTDSHTPVAVTGLSSGVAAIAAGAYHTCALMTAGGVQCWGYNASGQLGNGTITNSSAPVAVTGLPSGVAAIAVGGYHTCALTTAGGVQCWGYNAVGELGNGTTADSHMPVAVTGLSNGVAAIAAGGYHSCALTTAGGVQCWGYNASGQLGNGTTTNSSAPVAVTGLSSGVAAIAAGAYHTCALTTTGAVQCWGSNGYGQLGNGTTTNSATPLAVMGLSSGVAAIAAGGYHTCALTTAGGVRCWGYNVVGQLGNNTTMDSHTPVAVTGLSSGVAAIAVGGIHTCALTMARGVQCWGYNTSGQLGNGTTTNSSTSVAVTGLSSGVMAIAAGGYHTCAQTTAGGVQCWGLNNAGQLGNGTTTNSPTPVAVTGLSSGVAAIAAGLLHTCALTTAGGVQCWGDNGYGQLGNGTTTDSLTPVAVTGLSSGVAAITAGPYHTCALTTAGGVQCWGSNRYGQLGNGATTDSHTPVAVTGLSGGVAAIAAGAGHTCALTTVGGLQCWGYNAFGQLGNGTTTDSLTPVAVTGLSGGVAAITAGASHTCALTTAGGVQCWGWNYYGQLGNGTTTNSSTPVAMTSLSSGVAAIAAGESANHTCALTTAGGVRCWGWNYYGELGNGTTTDSHTPVAILAGQSIAFSPSQRMSVGNSVTLYATASGGGAVSFDSWTPSTCTFSAGKLILTNIGLCGVRASQAGSSDGVGGTLAAAPQQLRLIQVEPM